jgi:predicted permease
MTLRTLRKRLGRLLRPGQREAEMDAELRFHYEQLVDELRRDGMSEDEARLAARRELGDVGSYREEIRDAWRPPELADLWRTLVFAWRSLVRTPGFTAIAVLTLALGIGVNTVMFGVTNALIFKRLPYPDADRLDRIDRATAENPEGRTPPADFLDLRRENQDYVALAAYALADITLAEEGEPTEMARAIRQTSNLFATLGIRPQLGRDFLPEEEVPGRDRVVVLSRRAWRNRFGARADIVGHAVRIDGEPHVVVGVMPESFNEWRHLGAIDVFLPLALDAAAAADRQSAVLRVVGRRPPGLGRLEVDPRIAAFGARLAREHPAVHAGTSWRTIALFDTVQGRNATIMMSMTVALSGFVLLIACSNLANLLLARTVGRSRELAVRSALGASRAQLLKPLAAEALLLALAGGACALILASWTADWLSVRTTGDNGERVPFDFDWRVFSWAAGASLLTAIAFGLAPALFAMRLDLNDTLKSGGRGTTGARGHRRFRHGLIVGQFALATVLLAGAAVFIRGLEELNQRREGWQSERLVTATLALPAAGYPDAERIAGFQRRALDELAALPGVASASVAAFPPYFVWPDVRRFVVEGNAPPEPGREPAAAVNSVSPGYFETVGTRLLAGRGFDARDTAGAPRVYIVSRSMATALFGGASPIGRRLVRAGVARRESGEIVGVAADVESALSDRVTSSFQLYQPMEQEPRGLFEIAVRSDGTAPAAVVPGVRAAIMKLDADLPVRKLQPADATIFRANYQVRVLRDILALFAILGLALASLGIYGVIARTMAQRSGEFAIRFALGARAGDVTRLVLGQGLRLALLGSAIGLAGAFGLTRLLAMGFPGLRLESPPVLAGTTLLLVGVALLACWLPARRAARVPPIQALRAD